MKTNTNDREALITELQRLAESVLLLKAERRQKRPIVIEFCGSPKAGKTSCINSLSLFLKRNGFSVNIVQERASVCPVNDKQSPMFNLWTACMSLSGLIGTLEGNHNNVDVLILDRGIFDALCWFQWLVSTSKMEEHQRKIAEQFLLMDEFVKCIDIVFAFCVKPSISIEREYATLLTNKLGSIMNNKVLSEYLDAVENTISTKQSHFHKVFKIDTSKKNQDEVGKEVTEITLSTLKDLLMERIGYVSKDSDIEHILASNQIIDYETFSNYLPDMCFNLREEVENNSQLLQPIPVAVITNKNHNKILVIKKNKNAVSSTSPEKDKTLLYIGGHSRYEDQTDTTSNDFLSICRMTLKREIKEEIGISVAVNDILPFFIYSSKNEKSKKHLAVCFVISLDEDTKLHLDPNELLLNKGKSKSGKFLSLEELQTQELEDWSKLILQHCFNINISNQLSMFE